MLQNVAVGLVVLGIPVGLLLLRTNAALVIFALFAGAAMSRMVTDEVVSLVGSAVPTTDYMVMGIGLGLMVIPALVIALHFRKSAGAKLFLQLPSTALSGLTVLFLGVPILHGTPRTFMLDNPMFREVRTYDDLAIAGSVLSSMLVLVALYKRAKPDEGGKHHK